MPNDEIVVTVLDVNDKNVILEVDAPEWIAVCEEERDRHPRRFVHAEPSPNACSLNRTGTAHPRRPVKLALPAVGDLTIKVEAIAFPVPCVTMDVRRMTI